MKVIHFQGSHEGVAGLFTARGSTLAVSWLAITYSPLHLCAPQHVSIPLHDDRKPLALLDGVHLGGDGAEFGKGCLPGAVLVQALLHVETVPREGGHGTVHPGQVPPEVAGTVSR